MRGWGRLGNVSEKQREHSGDRFRGQDQGDGEDEAVVTQGGSKGREEEGRLDRAGRGRSDRR